MPDKRLLVKAVAMAMEPPPAHSARGYGYRAPPPPQTVLHPTLQLHGGREQAMSAELRAAKQRVLATELATQRETLAGAFCQRFSRP